MRRDILSGATLVVLLAVCKGSSAHNDTVVPLEVSLFNGSMYAACKMRPTTALPDDLPKVYGHVLFKQDYPDGKLKVHLRFHGFPMDAASQPRAVHIHQYGDVHGGCGSTGGHFNPHGVNHPNHPGDFGNFTPKEGKINTLIDSNATLFGPTSAIGRAVVVHESADDLGQGGNPGSLLHGNAGQRLGCCVIGISSPKHWSTSND